MIGDQDDILRRLKNVLPPWFGDEIPLIDALLSAPANVLAQVYQQILYARLQTRIATATETWLDAIARDFFGFGLQRRAAEQDAPYRQRIKLEIFRQRITRSALSRAIHDLTGIPPKIFEPARIADTGALGSLTPPTFAFNKAGAWGSLNYPDQFFITCFRPPGVGIPNSAGLSTLHTNVKTDITCDQIDITCDVILTFCDGLRLGPGGVHLDAVVITSDTTQQTLDSAGGIAWTPSPAIGAIGMPGGWGVGAFRWGNLAQIVGAVTDEEIYRVIDRTIAAGVTAWTKIVPYDGASPANLISWAPLLIENAEERQMHAADMPQPAHALGT
ncbi:MAG: hypothetical protein ACREC4_00410 [Methylocella sp.]